MNEQLQKLIDSATTKRRSARINIETLEPELIEPPHYYTDFDKVKFAYLIVQQCKSIVQRSEGDVDWAIWKIDIMFEKE